LHVSDENVHNVVVGMVQLNTQYTTLCTDGNCILCDSTGALLFSKTTIGNLIRLTQINGDPNFSDMFVIGDDSKYSLQNLHKGRDLNKYMIKAFGDQVMNGCKALKTFPKEIDFIAISCSTYQASKMVLEALNFPVERSGLECLTKIPHMGTNDLIYQIEYGIEQGMIKKGSKMLVSGTSLGFSIGTMAIEWGVT
ncbi:MAG: hypothetical protein IH840_18275, partial [Candidatus Heimdallarchaeota archaeon]|nr:hypothetical protein [Candidatus Heimdallarchaeota archaeon]